MDGWPSLKLAGFKTVDAVLPNPANSDEAYFFSGEQYALINIKPGTPLLSTLFEPSKAPMIVD